MNKTHAKKGRLFILSAPSGTGKTTLCRRILSAFPDMSYSVSYTTREPREGEKDGREYHFISAEKFEQMIREDRWAEWAVVHGNYYGTSADLLERELAEGRDVLLDIDVNGAAQIIKRFPQSVTIFIMPPSMEALRQRLEKRSSEPPAVIEKRLRAAEEEIAHRHDYKHLIVNDSLEEAAQKLEALIREYRASSVCATQQSANTSLS
ncbi:MAG: guanylate kinase [Thermodesulfobacteriota bacterium]